MDSTYFSRRQFGLIFFLLVLLGTIGQVSSDIYLPSLPNMVTTFHTSISHMQLSITLYMLGYSLSQLVYGPLSDHIGRRIPLIIGLIIAMAGTVLCIATTSIHVLLLGRLLQGLGTGAGNALSITVLRDLTSGRQMARLSSFLIICNTFVMASAPTLGGYLEVLWGWHSPFLLIIIFIAVTFSIVCLYLPETNSHNHQALQTSITKRYLILLKHPTFMGYTLCSTLSYASILAYITVAPFLFQNVLSVSPIGFGWLAVTVAAAYIFSGVCNAFLVSRHGIPAMMKTGLLLMAVGSISLLIFGILNHINILSILCPSLIFFFGTGFIFANAMAGAFTPFPHMAGVAGALFGCLQIFGGSVSSAFMTQLRYDTPTPLAIFFLVIIACMILSTWLSQRPLADTLTPLADTLKEPTNDH